jgi:GT2 family glycosyltransferase
LENYLLATSSTYVIIVNWNGKEVLKKCLATFFANTNTSNVQMVLVDNASIDGSVEMVQRDFPQIQVVVNKENLGFSKGNNQGIQIALEANAKQVLLLNNDVEITSSNWLETLSGLLNSDSKIGVVGCKLLFADGKIQHAGGCVKLRGAYHRGEREEDRGQYDRAVSVDYVTGAALLIKSDAIRKIGFLDEGFTPLYCEDTDWCVRAKFFGYRIIYTPKPALIHHCGSSAKKLGNARNRFYFRRSSIRLFLLNYQPKDILKRILRYEIPALFSCFIHRTHGGPLPVSLRYDAANRFSLFVKAWMPSVRGLKEIMAKRRQRFILNAKLQL